MGRKVGADGEGGADAAIIERGGDRRIREMRALERGAASGGWKKGGNLGRANGSNGYVLGNFGNWENREIFDGSAIFLEIAIFTNKCNGDKTCGG